MRHLHSLCLLLATANAAFAEPVREEFNVAGQDLKGKYRGSVTVVRTDEATRPDQAEVQLNLTFTGGRQPLSLFSNEVKRQPFRDGWFLTGRLQDYRFGLTIERDGTCTGSLGLLSTGASARFTGGRVEGPLDESADGDAYQRFSALQKTELLWRKINTPYSQEQFPALASRGVISLDLLGAKSALVLPLLRLAFSEKGDVREPHHKIFHTFGTVARVEFVPVARSAAATPDLLGAKDLVAGTQSRPQTPAPAQTGAGGYTGVFASGAHGLIRLSLGAGNAAYMPGIGLKLLVDGQDSLDVLAIPGFSPRANKEFLHPDNACTNDLPAPSGPLEPLLDFAMKFFEQVAKNPGFRPVDHLARVRGDGSQVLAPKSPRALVFRPAEGATATARLARLSHRDDFRVVLGALPANTVLYKVYARDSGLTKEVLVGRLITRSRFVASEFGDRQLNFEHTGETTSPNVIEKLKRPVAKLLTDVERKWGTVIRDRNTAILNRLKRIKDLGALGD